MPLLAYVESAVRPEASLDPILLDKGQLGRLTIALYVRFAEASELDEWPGWADFVEKLGIEWRQYRRQG